MNTRVLIVALLLAAPQARALDYQPLQGDYAIGGKTLIDPPDDEAHDSHLYLELSGDAARDLYRALKAKPHADACGDTGDLVKRAGAIACTKSARDKAFRCTFGIELGTQRVVNGGAC